MELDGVRKELNNYDNMIKNMLNLRMALIPIVADIKIIKMTIPQDFLVESTFNLIQPPCKL